MCNLSDLFAKRRSIYHLKNEISISDNELENIIKKAIDNVPSAFNSQSSRIVLLLNQANIKFWNDITLNSLKKVIPENNFEKTKNKIESFSKGYGTVLYFEDMNTVKKLEKQFPEYSDNFIVWANQTSAMLQYMIWSLFAEKNIGANLQHYNPLIDNTVKKEFNIDKNWKLIAQMPFGNILKPADEKNILNTEEKIMIFK